MLTLVQTTLKLNSNYKSTIFKKYIFVLVMIPRVLEIVSCHKWKRILDCCLKRDKKLKPLKNQKSEFFLTIWRIQNCLHLPEWNHHANCSLSRACAVWYRRRPQPWFRLRAYSQHRGSCGRSSWYVWKKKLKKKIEEIICRWSVICSDGMSDSERCQ